MSPAAANKRRATATPMMPPMKWAGMITSMLAVRPKRLSATRTGRLGASVGTSEEAACAALVLSSDPFCLVRRRRWLPLAPLPGCPCRRNHWGRACVCVRVSQWCV